jgi:hypothetical protein
MELPGRPPNKALLPLGQDSLLDRAVATARAVLNPEHITVVGDEHVGRRLPADISHVPASGSIVDNLVRGFEHHGGHQHNYIVLSSDLPFLTAEALQQFFETARHYGDLAVPIVSREDFLARFPGAPNKFERIGGRYVTMGSAFYFSGAFLRSNVPLMRDFAKYRKSPTKLAMLLGFEVLWGFLTRSITIETLERRASAIGGGTVRAVPTQAAELAYDIDSIQEYEFAQRHVENRL